MLACLKKKKKRVSHLGSMDDFCEFHGCPQKLILVFLEHKLTFLTDGLSSGKVKETE